MVSYRHSPRGTGFTTFYGVNHWQGLQRLTLLGTFYVMMLYQAELRSPRFTWRASETSAPVEVPRPNKIKSSVPTAIANPKSAIDGAEGGI